MTITTLVPRCPSNVAYTRLTDLGVSNVHQDNQAIYSRYGGMSCLVQYFVNKSISMSHSTNPKTAVLSQSPRFDSSLEFHARITTSLGLIVL